MIDDDYDEDGFDDYEEAEFGGDDELPEGFGAESFGENDDEDGGGFGDDDDFGEGFGEIDEEQGLSGQGLSERDDDTGSAGEGFGAADFAEPSPPPEPAAGGEASLPEDALAGLAALLAGSEGSADLLSGHGPADELSWRETYFVLFEQSRRPTLTQVEGALADAGARMTVENLEADDDGLFQSLLVKAPQDNAAIEVSYEAGPSVAEQSAELAKMLGEQIEGDQLALLMRADARLDVMHFEQTPAGFEVDPDEGGADDLLAESLDPATLITVVEALSDLTGGLPVDPAAGELLN